MSNWSREVLGGVPEAGISIGPLEVSSFAACRRACSMSTRQSSMIRESTASIGTASARRSILPRRTWIYLYGAPPANIGHVAQLRFSVLLRSGCDGCAPVLTFASHARACFYRVKLSTHICSFRRQEDLSPPARGRLPLLPELADPPLAPPKTKKMGMGRRE